jgi:hypothetical protein
MDIKTELDNFLGERRNLVEAIAREFRAGTPAKALEGSWRPQDRPPSSCRRSPTANPARSSAC